MKATHTATMLGGRVRSAHARIALLLLAIAWGPASGADVHRLIGLERSGVEKDQAEPGRPPPPTGGSTQFNGMRNAPPATESVMRIEPVPEDEFPTSWLVRTQSGETRIFCGRSFHPDRSAMPSSGESKRILLR